MQIIPSSHRLHLWTRLPPLQCTQVRHAWLLASELAPWCEPICKRPPTAAKTRGQLVDRDADAAAARDGRVREASSEGAPRKRVRFSDEVAVIGFSQPCHDDDDDGGA